MKHATYIGNIEALKGLGAIVMDDPMSPGSGQVTAQFDNSAAQRDWHFFPASDFQTDEPAGEPVDPLNSTT